MQRVWWKEAVVYQVYWRSFFDSNGDGYGDLQGLMQKLDYIHNLGVDIIWLNPFYESPDIDHGYDVTDYYSIMEKAGTMKEFEQLVEKIHSYQMKVIIDLVVNHTSDQHPWFLESRSSKNNPKRDYYIWRDKPTNWRSRFTPSAWEYDPTSGEYYFHSYAVEQPDLNWKNPVVRQEIYNMMRFWLDKGVDGFRMDSINFLSKIDGFTDVDDPADTSYFGENPQIHEYLQEMREQVLQHYDVFTVGEIPFATPEKAKLYTGEDRKELNTLFHFEVCDDMEEWDLPRFRQIQKKWYEGLWQTGWNSQFLNNHDHTRLVSRYGNDQQYRVESAKLFATMLHTLPGTPYIYQGEEIGMTAVRFDSIHDYQDVAMLEEYKVKVQQGEDETEVLNQLIKKSRDNSRTPMQWDDGKYASFSTVEPWMKVNPNYRLINVNESLQDPNSIYYYYQRLIQLRKNHPVMTYGSYQPILEDHVPIYAYIRELEGTRWLVILNPSEQETIYYMPQAIKYHGFQLIIANYNLTESQSIEQIPLRPYEALVYELK